MGPSEMPSIPVVTEGEYASWVASGICGSSTRVHVTERPDPQARIATALETIADALTRILEMLEAREDVQRMGQRGRHMVEEQMSLAHYTERLAKYVESDIN